MSRTNRRTRRIARRGSVARTAKGPGDFEKAFYVAALSFALVFTALLTHGAAYSGGSSAWEGPAYERPAATARVLRQPPAHNAIYGRAMVLAARYDSRPYWHSPKLAVGAPTSLATADLAIEHLIPCESGGRVINRVDSNGKMSYGILQFQDWPEWERISGIHGDPDDADDAIRMAEWGIQNGMIDHWGCARILGEM